MKRAPKPMLTKQVEQMLQLKIKALRKLENGEILWAWLVEAMGLSKDYADELWRGKRSL